MCMCVYVCGYAYQYTYFVMVYVWYMYGICVECVLQGSYGGRKLLSEAFRNRFVELHVDEIPADVCMCMYVSMYAPMYMCIHVCAHLYVLMITLIICYGLVYYIRIGVVHYLK